MFAISELMLFLTIYLNNIHLGLVNYGSRGADILRKEIGFDGVPFCEAQAAYIATQDPLGAIWGPCWSIWGPHGPV